jgi:hypothetical protein
MPQKKRAAEIFASHFPPKIPIQDTAFYSRREAAAALGVHELTLLKHEQRGNLRGSRAGRKVLYRGLDLRRWVSGDDE